MCFELDKNNSQEKHADCHIKVYKELELTKSNHGTVENRLVIESSVIGYEYAHLLYNKKSSSCEFNMTKNETVKLKVVDKHFITDGYHALVRPHFTHIYSFEETASDVKRYRWTPLCAEFLIPKGASYYINYEENDIVSSDIVFENVLYIEGNVIKAVNVERFMRKLWNEINETINIETL